MKIRTHISKYHFIRIIPLFIMLMWQVNVQAQADSMVTYTFNDTTMTFNIQSIRASLLNTTDLSPEEVEATLVYEPFWRSLFPPVESTAIPDLLIPNAGRVEQQTCIGFENVITDANGEVTGVSPWTTECACASGIINMSPEPSQVVEEPYTFHNINWTPGIDCYTGDCPQSGNTEVCEEVLVQSQNAFTVIDASNDFDPFVRKNGMAEVIQMRSPLNNDRFIRIGDQVGGSHVHRMKGTFEVTDANPILKYSYAVAMQDTQGENDEHGPLTLLDEQGNVHTGRPYLTVRFKSLDTGDEVSCGDYSVIGVGTPNSALQTTGIRIGSEERNFAGMAIDWTTNTVDLSEYIGHNIEVEITLAECNQGGHTAWAYLDFLCEKAAFEVTKEGDGCTYNFTTAYTDNYGDRASYQWTFMDEFNNELSTSNSSNPSFTYNESGTYKVQLDITYCNFSNGNADLTCEGSCEECGGTECTVTFTETVTICCDFCESSFAPLPGAKYVVSAWVKEDIPNARTYDSPNISLYFEGPSPGTGTETDEFKTSGAIIDGWQRIEAEFTVPADAEKIKVQLNNSGGNDVFFDDIRIHPFDASMKSFVYDPVTLRLSAELDERNYATYYEYDEEGALIRIKKETERGIMTIQEARNGIQKAQ